MSAPAVRPGEGARPDQTGSAGRATAGLLRVGSTVGAAITDHRELGPVEARIMIVAAVVLLALGILSIAFPRILAYPLAAAFLWIGTALLFRGYRLRRKARRSGA